MKSKTFKAEILTGHKDSAVEVPFNPVLVWRVDAKPLWRGRKGHEVKGKLNGVAFESFIVPRSKTFWMLIDEELKRKAKLRDGQVVSVSVELVN
jgi:hypothetical protein